MRRAGNNSRRRWAFMLVTAAAALLAALVGILLPGTGPHGPPGVPVALADDDGGGDDGGGRRACRPGDRSGGGGRNKTFRSSRRGCDLFSFRPCRRKAARSRRGTGSTQRPAIFAPNEIIATGLTDADIAALSSDGYTILDRRQLSAFARAIVKLRVPAGVGLENARLRVSTLNRDARIDFNHYCRPQAKACQGQNCASLALISWPPEAAIGCGPAPVIGMIDTGINLDHSALSDSEIEVLPLNGDGRAPSSKQHGTAIAALLVGSAKGRVPGLLPRARLLAVDAFYEHGGRDTRMEAFDLVRALDSLVKRKVRIINLSLAGPDNAVVADAVRRSVETGMVLVAAAGNAGPNSPPLYPAGYEGVIAVTAIDRGMKIHRRAVRGEHIDFAAPGVGIWSAASISGWKRRTGTSFATPFVTAAVALAMARGNHDHGDDVAAELSRSAQDLGAPGRDPVYGWGLIQAANLCSS